MNQLWPQAESVLAEAYQRQTAACKEALGLAERILAAWQPGQDINSPLQQIRAKLDEVASSNAAVDKFKQQWLQSRQQPAPVLASAMQDLTTLIARLAARIQELEQLAMACRDQLAPELDNLLRARQMQRAYAAARINKR